MGTVPKNTQYNLARISDRNGDLTKRWYIDFYIWDVYKNEKVRKFDRTINQLKRDPKYKDQPEELRKAMWKKAREIKTTIDKALKSGWFIDSYPKPKERIQVQEITANTALSIAVKTFFNQKKENTDSEKSAAAYTTHINLTTKWMSKSGCALVPLSAVDYSMAKGYMDWYQQRINEKTGEKISNTSYNKQLIHWKSFFNDLVDTEVIRKNPIKKLKSLPELHTSNMPYSDELASEVMAILDAEDFQLKMIAQAMYYCFIRRNELRFTKVKDIQGSQWRIQGKIIYKGKTIKVSKNGQSQVVAIPKVFKKQLENTDWLNSPREYFLFGRGGHPSPEPVGRDNFTTRYSKLIVKPLNLNGHTLYAFKHTGVCKLYRKFKDIEMIRRQCRHTEITTTMNYLRELAMFDENEIEEGFPEL